MNNKIILKSSEKLKDLDLEEGELGMVGQQPYSLLNGSKTRVVGDEISFTIKGRVNPYYVNPNNNFIFYLLPVCLFDYIAGSKSTLDAHTENANGESIVEKWGVLIFEEFDRLTLVLRPEVLPPDPYDYFLTYEGTLVPGKEEVVSE